MAKNSVASKIKMQNHTQTVTGRLIIDDPTTTPAPLKKELYLESPIIEVREVSSVFFKDNRGRMLEEVRQGIAYLIKNKTVVVAVLRPCQSSSAPQSIDQISSTEISRKHGEILNKIKDGKSYLLTVRDRVIATMEPPRDWMKLGLGSEEIIKLLLLEDINSAQVYNLRTKTT